MLARALLTRAILVWLVLIAVEFVHGALRTLYLAPIVGDFRARQIGVFIGSALILLVAYVLRGCLRAADRKALLRIGALWVALTLAFELLFGRFVFGRSWGSLAQDYDPQQGGLMIFGMIVLGLAPWLASELHRRKATQRRTRDRANTTSTPAPKKRSAV